MGSLTALASISMCRQGAQFVEVWVDGFAFTDLSSRQEGVATQREELERLKKQQQGKRKTPQLTSPREQMEREEMFKMRAAILKKASLG